VILTESSFQAAEIIPAITDKLRTDEVIIKDVCKAAEPFVLQKPQVDNICSAGGYYYFHHLEKKQTKINKRRQQY
jgi:hypothetical protein